MRRATLSAAGCLRRPQHASAIAAIAAVLSSPTASASSCVSQRRSFALFPLSGDSGTRRRRPAPCITSSSSCCCCVGASLELGAPLHTQRRHQRHSLPRPRQSTWRRRTAQHESEVAAAEAKAKEQRQRRETAGSKSGRRGAAPSSSASASAEDVTGDEPADDHDVRGGGGGGAAVREPYHGFLSTLLMRHKRRGEADAQAPLNPLSRLNKGSGSTHASRLLEAVDGMTRQAQRQGQQPAVYMDEQRRNDLVYEMVRDRWYGVFLRPLRGWSDRQIKWTKRLAGLVATLLVLADLGIVLYLYSAEMAMVQELSPQDRRDYVHMALGMRYSDIVAAGRAELQRVDPHEALPPAARNVIVIQACRDKGWHEVDWSVAARERYPRSALRDGDWTHLMYWCIMWVGNLVTAGGAYYSDVLYNSADLGRAVREQEAQMGYVEAGPQPKPDKPSSLRDHIRLFFS